MKPAAGVLLADPARLAAVDRTLAVAEAAREALDRLAGLAAVVMDAPVGVVNLVGAEQQHLVGVAGMDEPLGSSRQISVQQGYYPSTLLAGEPLFIEDAAADPEFAEHPGYSELGFQAYAGVPLRDADGQFIGALVVADTRPHQWELTARDALVALARSVVSELALYQDMNRREQLLAGFEAAPAAVAVTRGPDHVIDYINPAYQGMLGDLAPGVPGRVALPELAEGFFELMDRVLATGETFQAAEAAVERVWPGEQVVRTRYFDFSYSRLGGDVDPAAGVLTVAVEVTDRVAAHQELARYAEQTVAAEHAARQAAEQAADRLRGIVGGLAAIVWEADAQTWECSFISGGAEELLGYPAHRWLGNAGFWQSIVHPDDRDEVARRCAQHTAAGRDYDLSYRMIAADGRVVWLYDVVHVVCDPDGTPREHQGVMIDITEQKRREQAAMLLAEAGLLLAGPGGVEDKLTAVAGLAVGELCDLATIWLRGDDGRFRPVTAAPAAAAPAVLDLAPITIPDDLDAAYRAGRPFVLPHVGEELLRAATADDAHYRAAAAIGGHSALLVPLVADGRTVGSLTLLNTEPGRRYDDADLSLAGELGQRVAAIVAAERVTTRQRQLQRITAALASADSVMQTAQVLIAGVGDAFGASALSVYTAEPDQGGLHLVHAIGYPPDMIEQFATMRVDDALPIADCARTGTPVWLRDLDDWQARYPHLAGHAEATGNRAGAALPLYAAGRVIGVLAASFPTSREFAPDERDFALTLVGQAAQAFERAAAGDERRNISETLQRSLLPQALPELSRLALTARYLPGSDGVEAGGDWYDVLDLDVDHVALVVGDVVGHGAPAAAVMGQLRSALASSLLQGQSPAQALEQLNRFADRTAGAQVSTVSVALLNTATGELCWACAGHPPPLVVGPQGEPRYLKDGWGPCLGVPARLPFREAHTRITTGASVLLYSDGLFERRGEVIDDGLDRLAGCAGQLRSALPDAFADRLLAQMFAERRQVDDVALVIARLLPPPR